MSTTTDMATLTGSAKQVAWATTVRAEMVAEITAYAAKHDRNEPEHAAELREALSAFVATVAPAAWWIEHRGWDGEHLIEWLPRLRAGKFKGQLAGAR
jgi:hypothetical protein